MKKPKILILGSGAIGCYFGGRLAQAGLEVSLVARSDYAALRNKKEIQIKSYEGDFSYRPYHLFDHSDSLPTDFDFVLVCQKALPQIPLVEQLRPLAKNGATLVLMQNGVEVEAPIAQAFPHNTVLGGIAFIGVSRLAPGKIHHQLAGGLTLGAYPQQVSSAANNLASWFQQAGVPAKASAEIQKERWKKLVWNASFNPVGVLAHGANTAQMLNHPATLRLIQGIMDEVIALAGQLGYAIHPDFAKKQIETTRQMPPYQTSMLLDFQQGRVMELEAILGNALKKAEDISFSAPYLTALYGLLAHYQPSDEPNP